MRVKIFGGDLQEVKEEEKKESRRNKFANIVNYYRFIFVHSICMVDGRAPDSEANPCSITYIFAYTTKHTIVSRRRNLLLLL